MNGLRSVISLLLVSVMSPLAAQEIEVMQLRFEHSEPGVGVFQSRLLMNERYLRLDNGFDYDDFMLFDRRSRQIHSVNHESRLLVILQPSGPKPVEFEMDFRVEQKPLQDAPAIGGQKAMEYRFFADDELCKTSVNVAGMLPQVRQALIDYRQVRQDQDTHNIAQLPLELKTACYMANNILHSIDHLQPGFPIMVSDDQGRQQRLLDFKQVTKPAQIFELPEDYRNFTAPVGAQD
mgnify:FL=1